MTPPDKESKLQAIRGIFASAGREHLLFWAGGVLILLASLFAARSLSLRISGLQSEIDSIRSNLSYERGVLEKSGEFLAAYKKMPPRPPEIRNPEEKMGQLAGTIERLAKEENLILNHIRPMPQAQPDDKQFLGMEAELEGDIGGISRFLYKVLSLPEFLKLERLRLAQKSPMALQLKAELEISLLRETPK
ncbi:MAG TPA: hypothetical protein PKL97_03390 [Candidatus Omnitrophota bacterium]|nr:hypothetical protein [Candidatus Omnitrophota bacterium]